MSLGFSAGDFLAVVKLVADTISCLKDVGGAKSDFQGLVQELDCLQNALSHLNRLEPQDGSPCVDSIRFTALSCRRPLEAFLGKLKRYEPTLGLASTGSSWKAPLDKVRFRFSHNDEIRKLQNYLHIHIGTINILLAEHGLETLAISREETEADRLHIKERLEVTKEILSHIQGSFLQQASAVNKVSSMLQSLYSMVQGEVYSTWKSLEDMVASVCVSTQQIYCVVLEIRESLAHRPDIRWTFFQDPIMIEDALGRKFPLPSEYDFNLLDIIIKYKFRDGPGSAEVSLGDYRIRDANRRDLIISAHSRLRPGSSLIMTIILRYRFSRLFIPEQCPGCGFDESLRIERDGKTCHVCNVSVFETEQIRRGAVASTWSTPERRTVAAQKDGSHADDVDRRLFSSTQETKDHGFMEYRYVSISPPDDRMLDDILEELLADTPRLLKRANTVCM